MAAGRAHPKKLKMELATALVADFHGAEASRAAAAEFERRFARAEGPVHADSVPAPGPLPEATASLVASLGLAPSKNVARQKVREGAVAVSDDGVAWRKVENPAEPFELGPSGLALPEGREALRARRPGPRLMHGFAKSGGRRLLLVGGAGRMGRLFARFFRSRGFDVGIADPAGLPRGYRSAGLEEAASSDAVLVATSLSRTAEAMRAVFAFRPHGLVFDIASVKAPLAAALVDAGRDGIEAARSTRCSGPTWPRSAGTTSSSATPGSGVAVRRAARRLFAGIGLKIRTIPLAEHDRWVARTMGLAHLLAHAAASTLAASGVDLSDVDGLASTSFRRLVEFAMPLLEQAPELTWAIQSENPEAGGALEELTAQLAEWRALALAKSPEAFAAKLAQTKKLLAGRRAAR